MTPDYAAARALHDEIACIDLHADTPKLMDTLRYDLTARHSPPFPRGAFLGHVDIPRMKEGGLAAQFFGMWTWPLPRHGCNASVHRQIDALEAAARTAPELVVYCKSRDEVLAAKATGRIAALAGIEGAHCLEGRLEAVEEFARRGVRYIGLLHFNSNELGYPQKGLGRDDTKGLTAFGRDVVREMNRLGVIVDLAHINRKGFFEALELSTTPPLVSHTGVAGVKEHWRNIDDEQLRAVASKGGAIGVIFAPRFLGGDGIDAVCDHLMHIIKVAGEDAPALGSDYDGMITPSRGLEDVTGLPRLTAALLARGVSRETATKILSTNALRVLADVPPRC